MSPPDREFEKLLRRALHAAVDLVEPAEDGLDRIRARLAAPYPAPIAWIMAASSGVARHARSGLQGAGAWLRTCRAAAGDGFRAALPGRVRPASVQAIAVLVIAACVLALASLSPQPIRQTAALILSVESGGLSFQSGRPASGTRSARLNGHGAKLPSGGAGVPAPGRGERNHSHTATASCAATASALTRPTAGLAGGAEPTACPTPSPATTPSQTPSASPTLSTSP